MLEILKINNDTITIKILSNKKNILGSLGIKSDGKNEFNVPANLFAIKTLLNYCDDNNLKVKYNELLKKWTHLQKAKSLNDTTGNPNLRHYQRVDVAILKTYPRFGLFNEMRTGKTPTILNALSEMAVNKVLFVVPKSTILLTWVPEIKNWTNFQCIAIKDDTIKIRTQKYCDFAKSNNCALVVSKNTFKNDVKNQLLTNFDFTLVIDEAHFLRNDKTAQSQSILEIANHVSSVYCLTGTPANNHPSDIFGILKVLDNKLYQNMDYWDFVEHYFGIIRKRITNFVTINLPKPNTKPQLADEFDYLVKKISIMRKQVDVRNEMPTIIKNDLVLTMSKRQMTIYNETLESMKKDLFYNKKTKITFLEIFTKLRTICTTPINEGIKELGAKFDWVLDYLTDNETDSIIVYSTFSNKGILILSEILTKHKLKHQVMTGKTSQDQRLKAINNFQTGKVKIILCNIKTANVGVTLDKGDVMIFLDRELNPTENEQAESRFFPTQLNDNKPRQIINLYCQGTIDLKIKTMINNKVDINKIINDQGIKFFE